MITKIEMYEETTNFIWETLSAKDFEEMSEAQMKNTLYDIHDVLFRLRQTIGLIDLFEK